MFSEPLCNVTLRHSSHALGLKANSTFGEPWIYFKIDEVLFQKTQEHKSLCNGNSETWVSDLIKLKQFSRQSFVTNKQ